MWKLRIILVVLSAVFLLFPIRTSEHEHQIHDRIGKHFYVYETILTTPTFLSDVDIFNIASGIVDGIDSSGILIYFESFEQAARFFVTLYLVESGMNPQAVSPKGRHIIGLGQVDLRFWTTTWSAKVLNYKVTRQEYITNLYVQSRLPVHIFKYYLDKANGNFAEAIRFYSGGVKNPLYLGPLYTLLEPK